MNTDTKAIVERSGGSCCGPSKSAGEDVRTPEAQARPVAGQPPKAVPDTPESSESGSRGCCCG